MACITIIKQVGYVFGYAIVTNVAHVWLHYIVLHHFCKNIKATFLSKGSMYLSANCINIRINGVF